MVFAKVERTERTKDHSMASLWAVEKARKSVEKMVVERVPWRVDRSVRVTDVSKAGDLEYPMEQTADSLKEKR